MLKTLERRKYITGFILAIAIFVAAYVAIPRGGDLTRQIDPDNRTRTHWLISFIELLNHKEPLHIAGHLVIFGTAAMLLGPWGWDDQRGSIRLAVRYGVIGAILMEAAQITVGHSDDTLHDLVWSTIFDLLTDGLAIGIALLLTSRYPNQLTDTVQRLRLA